MRRSLKAGSTSIMLPVWIRDTSSSTGAGLSGLAYNTASLVAEYRREGASSATSITLATATLGTYTSGGFVADGSLGCYELGVPNAALASGAKWVRITLSGAANMAPVHIEIQLEAVDNQDATRFGLSALPNAAAAASGGLPTVGTGSGQITLSSGAVTVGTNNDKTGYALTQAFPTNFSSLAITGGGAVTAGTVSDKTGYSLTQSFPTNFASLAITVGGAVTAGTVSDKTGYSLTQTFPSNFSSMAITVGGAVTAGTVSDKTGYSLSSGGNTSVATAVRDIDNTTPAVSSLGAAVNSAASAGDPWATSLPGAYSAGTAGHIIGNRLDATVSSRSTFAGGAVSSVTNPVTVGTNNDKTGYSLTQTFPTNFASLSITGGGAVTAGTVTDKTGYSLSQAFPTNFSSLVISGTGRVTVGAMDANVITAAVIATDAIDSDALAASAATEIANAVGGGGGGGGLALGTAVTFRNQDAVTAPTVEDCLAAAWASMCSRNVTPATGGTTTVTDGFVIYFPDGATAFRSFDTKVENATGEIVERL